jgi:hypothetical protein
LLPGITATVHDPGYGHDADMGVVRPPLGPPNLPNINNHVDAEFGSNLKFPVVYYGQFKSVACGRSAWNSASDDLLIGARKLEEITAK